ncbi:hypothetical protein SDRG_07993 [Saprolegnia diclina VS20]|uniref:Mediator of RNA polymerase II transcription subunit 9 n=1 Tax=Saprolegnia diclina (strain VS20) TaxID=1156394 RepID=T0QLJ3_SAPDV|nr:hypothetical protein SDRG_07993 [Saprolegnia diclina VS20]EQC34675.1 hypothetical protein SDRG_07993 [Saprolegnia diclina VS20]|eukprot:XP_008612081.1 hypothetical protein SDRG_07993 [Saprolegnia diclina VS20]
MADSKEDEKRMHETFDMLPKLIEILKDILAAGTSQEVTRVGDVSSTSLMLKAKYEEAARVLASLPGVDMSLEAQQDEIKKAKELLRQKSALMELYSETLFRGTDEPRAQLNDVFSRQNL